MKKATMRNSLAATLTLAALSGCSTSRVEPAETHDELVRALSSLDPAFGSTPVIAAVFGSGGMTAPADDYSKFLKAVEEGRAAFDRAARDRAGKMTVDWSTTELRDTVEFLRSDAGRSVCVAITDSILVSTRGVAIGLGGKRSLEVLSDPGSVSIFAKREMDRIREMFTDPDAENRFSPSPIGLAILIGAMQLDVVSSVRLREFLQSTSGTKWLEAREPVVEELHSDVLGPLRNDWGEAGIVNETFPPVSGSMVLPRAERQ